MLKRMEVFLIIAVFILITAVILIVYSTQRENEFKAHNLTTQRAIINGAAYAINLQLIEKYRHVSLFSSEYAQNLIQLYNDPTNYLLETELDNRLKQRFSDYFTYTLTDKKGIPKLINIESLVGHACQLDLNDFAKHLNSIKGAVKNKIIIHPQPFNYHYDIMAPLNTDKNSQSIFFVSFYLDEVMNILKTHELPGQKLILVRQSDTSLIEITSQGSRDKLKRDFNLSHSELDSIQEFKDIEGTDWRLINLSDASYVKDYIKGLWIEAAIIISLVSFALLILSFFLLKITSKRRYMK